MLNSNIASKKNLNEKSRQRLDKLNGFGWIEDPTTFEPPEIYSQIYIRQDIARLKEFLIKLPERKDIIETPNAALPTERRAILLAEHLITAVRKLKKSGSLTRPESSAIIAGAEGAPIARTQVTRAMEKVTKLYPYIILEKVPHSNKGEKRLILEYNTLSAIDYQD